MESNKENAFVDPLNPAFMLTNSNNESLDTSQDILKRPSIKILNLKEENNPNIELEIVEGNALLPDLQILAHNVLLNRSHNSTSLVLQVFGVLDKI